VQLTRDATTDDHPRERVYDEAHVAHATPVTTNARTMTRIRLRCPAAHCRLTKSGCRPAVRCRQGVLPAFVRLAPSIPALRINRAVCASLRMRRLSSEDYVPRRIAGPTQLVVPTLDGGKLEYRASGTQRGVKLMAQRTSTAKLARPLTG